MYAASSQCGLVTTCSAQSQIQTCQSSGWSGIYTYASCSDQTATTWYRDADGDVTQYSGSLNVTVNNLMPSIDDVVFAPSTSINEGESLMATVIASGGDGTLSRPRRPVGSQRNRWKDL